MIHATLSDRELGIDPYPRRARYGLLGGYKTAPAATPRRLDELRTAIRDIAENPTLILPGGESR